MFSFFTNSISKSNTTAYDFKFNSIDKNSIIDLKDFENKVLIIVNVASRCGYTNQYSDLQELWDNYKNKGLVVIGIPSNNFKQEPASNKEIKEFCETNFSIDFPMTEKTNVIGPNKHPFFSWARESFGISAVPKWNFHKIIVGKEGKIIDTFSSFTNPSSNKIKKIIDREIRS